MPGEVLDAEKFYLLGALTGRERSLVLIRPLYIFRLRARSHVARTLPRVQARVVMRCVVHVLLCDCFFV